MTTMFTALLQFTITFTFVFIRAFQNQNVVGGKYHAAFHMAYVMAIAEIIGVTLIVKVGWASIPPVGLGASLGVVSAMKLYRMTDRDGIFGTIAMFLFTRNTNGKQTSHQQSSNLCCSRKEHRDQSDK